MLVFLILNYISNFIWINKINDNGKYDFIFFLALYGRRETLLQNQRAKEEMQREAKEEERSVRSGR